MLSKEKVQTVLSEIEFRDWTVYLGETPEGRMYLQVQFMDKDSVTGRMELQKGRKWMLSKWMCPTEIVRTAHKAVHAAMAHEVDESFKYKGVRVFGPHVDIEALVKAAKHIDVREPFSPFPNDIRSWIP